MRRYLPLALFAAFTVAAFGAIRSYDLFWQLAAGRWIVEHRALPHADPFAVASDKGEWIDGEWLYEVALYGAHSLVGLEGLSWLRGLLAAAIFTMAFAATRRENDSALLVSAIAFAGAMPVLDLRPSSVAALLLVLMLAASAWWARALLAIVWINVHPSALLAPAVAAVWSAGGSPAGPPAARRYRPAAGGPAGWQPALPIIACALALLVNPFGWKAIVAPVRLTSFVGGGTFVNAEWLPSSPQLYPVLYAAIAIAIGAFAVEPQRDWKRIALLALFALLAVRSVRNQPLFFAAFAMLVRLPKLRPALVYGTSAAAIAIVGIATDHRPGVPPERFPIAAVAQLKASGLRGNVYNPDQFGGFLIWSFYPERRALTDGRNELYRTFIPEWQQAREDGRKWSALLRKYDIDLAVEEYRPPLSVKNAATGEVTSMPAHLAYWPEQEWVMIGRDEAAMVFARRSLVSSRARGDR
ncbi:MAG TPA: hypothetical protein VFP80_02995 [Thermoanaerobaculia bacterium]|nr:hypothetical protein [Thermoanaerobaculia bacterium]